MNPESGNNSKLFTEPQRQSILGLIIIFARTFSRLGQAFWPILVIMFLRKPPIWAMFGVALGFFVLIGLLAFLRYYYFVFYGDEKSDEFVVEKGVINKTKLSIPFRKIQQVNLQQPLLYRIINVYKLEIDTAGSGDEEVNIPALDHRTAQELKAYILDQREEVIQGEIIEVDKEVSAAPASHFFQISLPALLKTGLTSHYLRMILIIVGFFVTLSNQLREFWEWEDVASQTWVTALVENLGVALALVILFLSVTLLINMVFLTVRYFGFTVEKTRQALQIHYGLLNKKSTFLYPNRVQKIEYANNYLQKKLKIRWIRLHQAGGAQSNRSTISIPGANTAQSYDLEQLIYRKAPHTHQILKPNWRWVNLRIFWEVVFPIGVILLVQISTQLFYWTPIFVVLILYSILQGIKIYYAYSREQLRYSEQFVIHDSGSWDQTTSIIEPHKVQSVHIRQYFWQKRSNRASIRIHIAGGTMGIRTSDKSQIDQLANQILYQTESSKKYWM